MSRVEELRVALAELAELPLVLADAGARGDVPEPWNALGPEALTVIGFEPDAEECARLNELGVPGRTFLPVALWSSEGEVDVHLAATASCSSVHPPNAGLLARYAARHGLPRETEQTVRVPATTLDAVAEAEGLDVDFLKIDTQGSEYEILAGARQTLRTQAIGVLVETWTTEVHEHQRLSGDVMTLMHESGFELFDVGVAASWQRRIVDTTPLDGKGQVMGLDLLFFRPGRKTAKLAAVATLYGFPDFGVEIAEGAGLGGLADAILRSAAPPSQGLRGRLRGRVARDYPPLHT